MIVSFSKNPINQARGIIKYNWIAILFFALLSTSVALANHYYEMGFLKNYVVPVSILGGGLAIFLGFRNNSAYDRWWEARKVWGGIINSSRTWARQVTTLATLHHTKGLKNDDELKGFHREMVYRHLAWINALRLQLRGQNSWDELDSYISKEEKEELLMKKNKVTSLGQKQGERLTEALKEGVVEDFRHMQLDNTLTELTDLQGKAERIKNTIFPFYYTYFTNLFLWIFTILLPCSLAQLGWFNIPISVAISFVFYILNKAGSMTEDPFRNVGADVPISALCTTIEIDLKQQLGETVIPEAQQPEHGKFGVRFIK